jgi:sigma-B regulation protein RsbU (phosphoserine phosphatase)
VHLARQTPPIAPIADPTAEPLAPAPRARDLGMPLDDSLPPITATTSADAGALANLPEDPELMRLENLRLRAEVHRLRERDEWINQYLANFDEELRLARRLQHDFLPKSMPKVGPVRFHALYRPAGYVSGDLYWVVRLDERHVGFCVADAVGHGMPAALLTMFMKNALTTKELTGSGYHLLLPSKTMHLLNVALAAQELAYATFATALYGYIDTQTLKMTFARGGHPHPIIIRHDDGSGGAIEIPKADGPLLGIFPDSQFTDCTVQLERGDRVFVFTDGVDVVMAGERMLGADEWGEELYRRRGMTTQEILTDLVHECEKCAGSLSPRDDMTIVAIEIE